MKVVMSKGSYYLYAAFVIELLLVFYLRNDTGYIFSPLLITGTGIFLAVFPYFIISRSQSKENVSTLLVSNVTKSKKDIWYIFSALSLFSIVFAFLLFNANPIDIKQSDIIPFIKDILVKRFLAGEHVYAPVKFNDYPTTFTPNYLPFQWMPFTIAELLKLDLRWVCLFAFLGSAAFYIYQNNKENMITKSVIVNACLPFVVLFSIYIKQPKDSAHTIEILMMAYYLFLATSLFMKNNFVKALALTFPFLSRFSFLFWIPVYFYTLLRTHKRMFFIIGLILIALISMFFIIPFVLPDPAFLKSFNDIYLDGAIGEWNGQSWQQPGDRPFQLFQGMGFASWFYIFFEGSLKEKILALKTALLIAGIISMLIPILSYKTVAKVVSNELFALMALKFSLTLFYAFILVPYIYLFWVPLMVSVVILSRTGKEII